MGRCYSKAEDLLGDIEEIDDSFTAAQEERLLKALRVVSDLVEELSEEVEDAQNAADESEEEDEDDEDE